MRPTAGFLLLIILAVPFIGLTAWFSSRMAWVRHDATRIVAYETADRPFVRLTFAVADAGRFLAWEHSREFKYRGEMYDVARSETTADSITYWCYHDRHESSLRREIDQWLVRAFGRPDPGAPAPMQQLGRFFAALFPPSSLHLCLISGHPAKVRLPAYPDAGLDRFEAQPPAPPPWFA